MGVSASTNRARGFAQSIAYLGSRESDVALSVLTEPVLGLDQYIVLVSSFLDEGAGKHTPLWAALVSSSAGAAKTPASRTEKAANLMATILIVQNF